VAGRDVPLITDYARSDKDRSPLRLLASTSALSRPLVAPPGVPAARIEILRNAFDMTMEDPGFLGDATKAGMDIKPISGIEIQSLVKTIVPSAPEDIELALKLTQ
jgi:hypothetical protein